MVEKLIEDWSARFPHWEPSTLPDLQPGGNRGVCPNCDNGSQGEDCFSLTVENEQILWCCHRQNCKFQGRVALGGEFRRSAGSGRGTAAHTASASTIPQQAWQGQGQHVRASSAAPRLPQQQPQVSLALGHCCMWFPHQYRWDAPSAKQNRESKPPNGMRHWHKSV